MKYEAKRSAAGFTIFQALTMLVVFFFSLHYGQKATASEKTAENGTSAQSSSGSHGMADNSPLELLQNLSQAQTDGKYAFILFYEAGNSDCQIMSQRLDEFAEHAGGKARIFKIDRNKSDYSTIVDSMRVRTAPVPLTLVKDPAGRIVKSFTTVVSEEELAFSIPSPKKTESIALLQDGKSLIVSFTSRKMAAAGDVDKVCEEAKKKLNGKTEYIKVDLSDAKEAGFARELSVDLDAGEPVTFVVNSSRQTTGRYAGMVEVDDLVQSATKVAAGGCCPAGSGKSCGPVRQ